MSPATLTKLQQQLRWETMTRWIATAVVKKDVSYAFSCENAMAFAVSIDTLAQVNTGELARADSRPTCPNGCPGTGIALKKGEKFQISGVRSFLATMPYDVVKMARVGGSNEPLFTGIENLILETATLEGSVFVNITLTKMRCLAKTAGGSPVANCSPIK